MRRNYASPRQTSRRTISLSSSLRARLFTLINKITFHKDTPIAHQLGRAGERYVRRVLEQEGMRVLSHNWRSGRLELDLVMVEPRSRTIVFVEVKTRQGGSGQLTRCCDGISLLAEEQEGRLIEAANRYLERYSLRLKRMQVREYRLELVGVLWRDEGDELDSGPTVELREVVMKGVVR